MIARGMIGAVHAARRVVTLAAVGLVLWSFAWVATRELRKPGGTKRGVTLRILHWGDPAEDAIVAGLVADFERDNPDVKVIRNNVGSAAQLATKLQTMLASGDPPDLFYLPFEKVADLASKQLLANIDEFFAVEANSTGPDRLTADQFFPAALNAFRFDGKQVGQGPLAGVPKDFTPVGFYYNRDLLKEAGLAEPPPQGWTWDEFHAAAAAIGKLPACHGAEFVTWESVIRIYLFTAGVDFASPGFETFHFDDPALVAALERLRGWFDEGRTLLSAKTQLETGQDPFLSGKLGMAGPYGRWKVPMYRRITTFDWDFTQLPHEAGHPPANGVMTVAWAMSRQARHPAESWRLIKHLCGPLGQRKTCDTGLAIPSMRALAASPCFVDPNEKPANDQAFLDAAEIARPIAWPPDPHFADQLKTGLESIFKLGRPVREQLREVARQWQSNRTVYRSAYVRMPWAAISGWSAAVLAALALAGAIWWRRGRGARPAQREELAGLGMLSPWLIGFALFTAFPVVLSLLLAFTRWSGMSPLAEAEWVGLDNFREMLVHGEFHRAVYVTAWYALLAVPTGQLAALIAAMLMNHEWRGIYTFRAIWYLPGVLAGVGMAILWKWVFHHEYGLLNALLRPVCDALNSWLHLGGDGLSPPAWLERDAQQWGIPAFAIINLWTIGGTMMIYLAGLKGIPRDLYEAAAIDGARGWRRFCNVTLPMLSPVIFFNVIIAIIASFQIFTQVFVMTGGGPGSATLVYVFYLYKMAFDLHQMGYASAMAWLLLLIVLVLTLLVMRGSRRFVYYEGMK